MRRLLDYFRTTMVGGLLFLLPLFIVYFVLEKAVELIAPPIHGIVQKIGLDKILGIPGRVIVALIVIALGAFLTGLFARTRPGAALLRWIEHGIEMALPKFSILQKVAHTIGGADTPEQIPVVLVATDAGWQLGLIVAKPHQQWYPVFLPGSPDIAGGSVSYAHADYIHPVEMSLPELWSIMRSRGLFSDRICAELAALDAAGKLARP